MKHFYNANPAVTVTRLAEKGLGTALSSKIYTILLLSFFLLVSRESTAQTGAPVYTNTFNTVLEQNNVSVDLTRGAGPSYGNGELTVSTGNGQNKGYNGWIRIATNYQVKIGYRYNITLKAKVSGSGANKNGTFSVKFGSPETVFSSGGTEVLPTVALNDKNTVFQNLISSTIEFNSSQTLVVGIYIDGAQNNSQIHFDDLVITEICAPIAPQVTSAGTCAAQGNLTLKATGATGNNYYHWYTVAAGGSPIANQTGAELVTGNLTVTTTYYVAIVNSITKCESARVPVTASISKLSAPVVTSNAQCGSNGSRTITFTASGAGANEDYRWYNSSGNVVATGSTINRSTNVSGETGVHYVIKFSTVTAGCESDRTYLVVPANNPTPNAPANITISRCVGGAVTIEPVQELGMTYRWYSSGGTFLGEGLTYTMSPVASGITTYVYRKLNTATGCISEPSTVTVNGTSSIAATGDIVRPVNPVLGQPATFSFVSNIQSSEIESYQWYYHKVGSAPNDWIMTANTPDWIISSMPGDIDAVRVILKLNVQNAGCYNNLNLNRAYEINDLAITPLPVEIVSFKAQHHTKGVNLTWATASELDNKGFEVQVSTDGKTFKGIGFVESKVGTTSIRQNYSFLDTKAVSGTRYYRLAQIDLDGATTYSAIRAVALDGTQGEVAAYPNPFEEVVTVRLNGVEARNVSVILTNAMGKVMLARQEETAGNTVTINTSGITIKGIYLLHVVDNGEKHTFKLMKR